MYYIQPKSCKLTLIVKQCYEINVILEVVIEIQDKSVLW